MINLIKVAKFSRALKIFLFLALFSFLAFHYFKNLKGQWFHVDEYYFIRKSYYFDLFFIKRDFQDPRWPVSDEAAQPKLGPYFYGLTLHLGGVSDIEQKFEEISFNTLKLKGRFWWEKLWIGVFRYEKVPEELVEVMSLVWLGRKTSVFFTLGALSLVFILGTKMKGVLFGAISALLLGLNTLMFSYGRLAMTDSMLLFFFLANILLVFYFLDAVRTRQGKKAIFLSFLMGTNAAFALGVKVVGILALIFLIILFLILFVLKPFPKSTSAIFQSFLIVISSFWVVFVFLHPYLHEDTFGRFFYMFSGRLEGAKRDQLIYPGSAVNSPLQAAEIIVRSTLLPKGGYTNFKIGTLPADLAFFLVGLMMLIKQIFNKSQKDDFVSFETFFILWCYVVIGGLMFYLRNAWPRYFLPTVSVVAITQSYAIATIFELILAQGNKVLSSLAKRPKNNRHG